MIEIFTTDSGKYAELHEYREPCHDDRGMPDGFNSVWEVYCYEKEDPTSNDFVTRTFTIEYLARMFLTENKYKAVVY